MPAAQPALDATLARKLFGTAGANTAADALYYEEVGRTRVFAGIMLGLIVFVLATLPLLGGDRIARIAVVVGGVTTGVAAVWLLHVTRDPSRYTSGKVLSVAVVSAFAAMTGIYYFGYMSPAPMVVVLGISFFSLSRDFRATLFVYLICVVVQVAFAALILSGVATDRGLIRPPLDRTQIIIAEAIVQFITLLAFIQARFSRRTTLDAIARLEEAVKAVAQREAILAEARQELERAAWIGGPGRFTEQTLGDFKLGIVIGRGAMGEVYQAANLKTGGPAAVKLLHRNVLADPDNIARFVREARAAQALETPHVVRVFEVATTDAPIPFLAMELLNGHDLAYHLRTERRFSIQRTLDLVDQIAEALEAARTAGVVHRDLKPQNLFLDEPVGSPSVWKILDFGMSKLADHNGTLTKGQVLGTPAFMAPEQARGGDVDHRADLYAVGAIVYRALTGHPAFTGDDLMGILTDVGSLMPRRPSSLASLPEDIDAVLAIALAKRPVDRFGTALELTAALRAASTDDLADDHRRRAAILLDRLPWGGRVNAVS
jgi:serine/threonine-protein kinase